MDPGWYLRGDGDHRGPRVQLGGGVRIASFRGLLKRSRQAFVQSSELARCSLDTRYRALDALHEFEVIHPIHLPYY